MSDIPNIVPPVDGNRLLLQSFADKVLQGRSLTPMEEGLAITSSNLVKVNKFGPSPEDMKAGETILPEQVKSMIFNAIS